MFRRHSIFQAFGLVASLSIVSKLLGFVREAIIANYFGTSIAADLFYVAFIIPTIAFTVIGSTARGRVLPLTIENMQQSSDQAHKILQGFIQLFLIIACIITAFILVGSQPLIQLIAPGFSSSEVKSAAYLTSLLSPLVIILTMASISQIIYHAHESFTIPAVGPVVNNFLVVLMIMLLHPYLGLYSLAVAVLIGGISQFTIQWINIPNKRLYFRKWDKQQLINSFKLLKPMIPILIATMALQLNTLVDRLVASFLEEGSIAALNYSYRLLWIPLSILLIPITTIIFPKLTQAFQHNQANYEKFISTGFKLILLTSIPFMIVMLLEASHLVSMVYERGAFDANATQRTSYAFIFYTLGLLFIALREYFTQHFYIVKDYKTIAKVSVIGVLINIIGSISLAPLLSINGIALATTLSMLFQAVYFYYLISKGYGLLNWPILIRAVLSLIMIAYVIYLARPYYQNGDFITISITSVITFALFYGVMKQIIHKTWHYLKGL
ncbi:murein biosynthesis integral membrane protein MurJ [Alkalibacillus sp. S2W]|uniref:murein biosynthesis integral membrane protein MurJ n=1 Tax=Alkalibacillus sp. S2W TaxID=3386553 RepID=UPI00398CF3A5